MHTRKPPKNVPPAEFCSWTTAWFLTEDARDRFVRVAASLPPGDVEAQPMRDEARTASVRWRPGKFLGLNDVAYALGGKIVVAERTWSQR